MENNQYVITSYSIHYTKLYEHGHAWRVTEAQAVAPQGQETGRPAGARLALDLARGRGAGAGHRALRRGSVGGAAALEFQFFKKIDGLQFFSMKNL